MSDKRPPKIKVPFGSTAKFSMIALPLILISLLVNYCSTGADFEQGRMPELRAEDVAEIIVPEAHVAPPANVVDRAEPIQLDHDGVLVNTGFGHDWTVMVDGRQRILTSPDNSTICQSLVIPRAEFDEMISAWGGIRQVVEALARASLEPQLPAGVQASISTQELFNDGSDLAPRQAYEINIVIGGQGRTFRTKQIVVWMANEKSGASLTCSRVTGDFTDLSHVASLASLYRFAEGPIE